MLALVFDTASVLAQTPVPKPTEGTPPAILVLIAVLGAGGLGGGIAALISARRQNRKLDAETIKVRAEADVLPIDLAKGAVVVQADVIKDLRHQLEDLRAERTRLETKLDEAERKHNEAEERADRAYRKLEARCAKTEKEVERLRAKLNGRS